VSLQHNGRGHFVADIAPLGSSHPALYEDVLGHLGGEAFVDQFHRKPGVRGHRLRERPSRLSHLTFLPGKRDRQADDKPLDVFSGKNLVETGKNVARLEHRIRRSDEPRRVGDGDADPPGPVVEAEQTSHSEVGKERAELVAGRGERLGQVLAVRATGLGYFVVTAAATTNDAGRTSDY